MTCAIHDTATASAVVNMVADVFPDCRFVLILVEPDGTAHTLSSEAPSAAKALLVEMLEKWTPGEVDNIR